MQLIVQPGCAFAYWAETPTHGSVTGFASYSPQKRLNRIVNDALHTARTKTHDTKACKGTHTLKKKHLSFSSEFDDSQKQ